MWIGKFETSNVENCIGTSSANTGCDLENLTAKIKPNETAWRYIRASTLEIVSMQLTNDKNIYGFDNTYDSHASKNKEWALMAYLTQSKYGKYGSSLYTGENKQVYMNNYSKNLTGCSSGTGTADTVETCAYRYDDTTSQGEGTGYAGQGASSTGNIYGIYDINGGAWEYTMGILNKMSGNTEGTNSGYTGELTDGSTYQGRDWPDAKYYDVYTSNDLNTACNGSPCKGEILGEVSGWYNDRTNIVDTTRPWFVYSGNHYNGVASGIFSYGQAYGSMNIIYSFRIVLTPNN